MKLSLLIFLFGIVSLFGDTITLDNETPYPSKSANTTIKLQWAASSQSMNEKTAKDAYQTALQEEMTSLVIGKNQINVPKNQRYFRVVVFTKGSSTPTYVTSWVPITSTKNYTVEESDLYSPILNAGSGC